MVLRRYFPLTLFAAGLFLALTLLPSALNLTQPNPSQTLEYAPVAPNGENAPSGGNLSTLGLGSSPGFLSRAQPDDNFNDTGGRGARPSAKRCVGNPPRQTEDPLSPPCVAFFAGDNGGSTASGVTRNEIRVLVYMSGGATTLCDQFVDLADNVPNEQAARSLAAYQRYFNDRYQTYDRFVHFILHRGKCGNYSAEARRADAETGYQRVRPFAAISFAVFDNQMAYVEALANRGVVTFLSRQGANLPEDFFTKYPGYLWGYNPTIEQFADLYSSYVCNKVVPFPVSFTGNPLDERQPRKLGHLYPIDPGYPEFVTVSKLISQAVEKCGGKIALTRNFSKASTPLGNTGTNDSSEAAQNIAAFQRDGITTILWTGGNEFSHSRSAGTVHYRPEFVVLGVAGQDRNASGSFQEQSVWRNAWVLSISTLVETQNRQLCYTIAKESDPQISETWATSACFIFYPSVRQAFTGIQVAGPRPTPSSIDRGFHAIPQVASTDSTVPACFYTSADYSCVKDGVPEWWDPSRTNELGTPGCYAPPERGKRYLARSWPVEDVPTRKNSNDVCNNSL